MCNCELTEFAVALFALFAIFALFVAICCLLLFSYPIHQKPNSNHTLSKCCGLPIFLYFAVFFFSFYPFVAIIWIINFSQFLYWALCGSKTSKNVLPLFLLYFFVILNHSQFCFTKSKQKCCSVHPTFHCWSFSLFCCKQCLCLTLHSFCTVFCFSSAELNFCIRNIMSLKLKPYSSFALNFVWKGEGKGGFDFTPKLIRLLHHRS